LSDLQTTEYSALPAQPATVQRYARPTVSDHRRPFSDGKRLCVEDPEAAADSLTPFAFLDLRVDQFAAADRVIVAVDGKQLGVRRSIPFAMCVAIMGSSVTRLESDDHCLEIDVARLTFGDKVLLSFNLRTGAVRRRALNDELTRAWSEMSAAEAGCSCFARGGLGVDLESPEIASLSLQLRLGQCLEVGGAEERVNGMYEPREYGGDIFWKDAEHRIVKEAEGWLLQSWVELSMEWVGLYTGKPQGERAGP